MNKKALALSTVIMMLLLSIISYTVTSEKPVMEEYEETEISLEVRVSIKNFGNAPAINIPLRLAVPFDHSPQQEVLSIAYSEPPERESEGTWNNQFVHFTVDRLDPTETWNISIHTKLRLTSIDFNLNKDNVGKFTNETDRFLADSPFINVNDPTVQAVAREILADSEDITDTVWNTYEWILDNIVYQQIAGEFDARTTLRNGEGGSAELSNLFVALLRANRIPAQRLSGWGNHFTDGEELHLTRFSHGWAEFYLPGYGWIQVDVAWGKNQKFDNFAKTDASHIILTQGAGIHFFWRGPFAEPYGETELETDYRLFINDIQTKNLSMTRTVISIGVFIAPIPFVAFIVHKRLKIRKL
jgi:hypothetical protein